MDDMKEEKLIENLFDTLIKEENRGQRFYRDAARFVSDREARRVFEWLAVEETYHTDVLVSMRKEFMAGEPAPVKTAAKTDTKKIYYDGDTIKIYDLRIEEDEEILPPQLELFRANDFKNLLEHADVKTVLKFAMQIEYENFKYLVDLAKTLEIDPYRNLLKQLADQEKRHFQLLRGHFEKAGGMTARA
ncbi:hypothetical protein JW905_18545 [bacterium]|nr:hypothetical protein [candidate division CSSED10-310 bacterium]